MKVTLPYGGEKVSFEVDDDRFVKMYDPVHTPPAPDFAAEIERALDHPVGTPRLRR